MLGHQKVWYNITIGNFKFHSISLNEYLNRFSKACPKPNKLKLQFSRGFWTPSIHRSYSMCNIQCKMFSIC